MPGLMDVGGGKPPEKKKKKYPVRNDTGPDIESIPVRPKKPYPCDAESSGTTFAMYEVRIKVENGVKPIHLCGHHFQEDVELFLERGYEIRKL